MVFWFILSICIDGLFFPSIKLLLSPRCYQLSPLDYFSHPRSEIHVLKSINQNHWWFTFSIYAIKTYDFKS